MKRKCLRFGFIVILWLWFFNQFVHAIHAQETCNLITDEDRCYADDNSGCMAHPTGSVTAYSLIDMFWDRPCELRSVGGVLGHWGRYRYWHVNTGGAPCCGGGCFLPGTKVATPGGELAIEALKIGDQVMSFDDKTGSVSADTVTQRYSVTSEGYFTIKTASGKEINVTAEHPIFTGTNPQPPKTMSQKLKNLWYRYTTYVKYGWKEFKIDIGLR